MSYRGKLWLFRVAAHVRCYILMHFKYGPTSKIPCHCLQHTTQIEQFGHVLTGYGQRSNGLMVGRLVGIKLKAYQN